MPVAVFDAANKKFSSSNYPTISMVLPVYNKLMEFLNEHIKCSPNSKPIKDCWRVNQKRFEILSKMAWNFFAIPTTSVPIEQVFSQVGELISKKRNRLSAKSIQLSMCFKSCFDVGSWKMKKKSALTK